MEEDTEHTVGQAETDTEDTEEDMDDTEEDVEDTEEDAEDTEEDMAEEAHPKKEVLVRLKLMETKLDIKKCLALISSSRSE